jgi:hypothetical protein
VRGRNWHNELIRRELSREPAQSLEIGIAKTHRWIEAQVRPGKQAIEKVSALCNLPADLAGM